MKTIENRNPLPFYRQAGSGTSVVALHGSASTGGQWQKLMQALEGRHRVIAPDLPGYGASREVASGSRSGLRATARAVAEIAIAAGEPVHLVGHSFGGTVALKIALVWPELVRSLTLIEPASFHFLRKGDAAERSLYAEISAVAGIMSAHAACDAPGAAMEHFVDYWNGENTWSRGLTAEQRRKLAGQLDAVLGNFAAGFSDSGSIEDCGQITCPVQVMMGLQSKAPTQRVAEMIAETVPNAKLTMIAEAGHMMPVTHPEEVNRAVAQHVSASEGVSGAREAGTLSTLTRWVA